MEPGTVDYFASTKSPLEWTFFSFFSLFSRKKKCEIASNRTLAFRFVAIKETIKAPCWIRKCLCAVVRCRISLNISQCPAQWYYQHSPSSPPAWSSSPRIHQSHTQCSWCQLTRNYTKLCSDQWGWYETLSHVNLVCLTVSLCCFSQDIQKTDVHMSLSHCNEMKNT